MDLKFNVDKENENIFLKNGIFYHTKRANTIIIIIIMQYVKKL